MNEKLKTVFDKIKNVFTGGAKDSEESRRAETIQKEKENMRKFWMKKSYCFIKMKNVKV